MPTPVIVFVQDVQAELQQEKDAHQVDTQRVLELSAFAEQLQTTKADLERQSAALMSDKRQLTSDNEQLTEDKEQLLQRTELLLQQQAESHRTTDSLRIENTSLAQQVILQHTAAMSVLHRYGELQSTLQYRVGSNLQAGQRSFCRSG